MVQNLHCSGLPRDHNLELSDRTFRDLCHRSDSGFSSVSYSFFASESHFFHKLRTNSISYSQSSQVHHDCLIVRSSVGPSVRHRLLPAVRWSTVVQYCTLQQGLACPTVSVPESYITRYLYNTVPPVNTCTVPYGENVGYITVRHFSDT